MLGGVVTELDVPAVGGVGLFARIVSSSSGNTERQDAAQLQAFKKPSLEQYAEQVLHQQNCSDCEFPSLMGLHCATQLSRVPPSARQWTVQPQPPWTSLQFDQVCAHMSSMQPQQ